MPDEIVLCLSKQDNREDLWIKECHSWTSRSDLPSLKRHIKIIISVKHFYFYFVLVLHLAFHSVPHVT